MKLRNILSIVTIATLLASCGQHLSVPTDVTMESRLPKIYPDYTEVTIPANICPLNFAVQEGETEAMARFTFPGGEYIYGEGQKVLIDEEQWKEILKAAKGKEIKVEVFAQINGAWKGYQPFNIYVAEDSIDQFISYRAIQPSYVAYER